jgi:YVTN family beta-propeller protein
MAYGFFDSFLQQSSPGEGGESTATILLSGGQVTIDDTDKLKVNIAPATYLINGTPYTYDGGSLILAPGDDEFERFDAIVLGAGGVASVIQGTPDVSATTPAIPGTKVLLSYISVMDHSTSDSGTTEVIEELKELLLGGHRQGDSDENRDNQPNKAPGMFYFRNAKFNNDSQYTLIAPSTISKVDNRTYVFNSGRNTSNTGIDINIFEGNALVLTKVIEGASYTNSRVVFYADNKLYFIVQDIGLHSWLTYYDIANDVFGGLIDVGYNTITGIYHKNKIYIGSWSSNTIYIINRQTFTLITTVPQTTAFSFAVDEDHDRIFCCSYSGTTIKVLNYFTNGVVKSLTVPVNTTGIATRAGKGEKSWIFHQKKIPFMARTAGQVWIYDTEIDDFIDPINVGSTPVDAVVFSCDLYVANKDSGTVSIIDLLSNELEKTIDVGDGPCTAGNLIVNDDSIFVPVWGDGTIVEIEAKTGLVMSKSVVDGQTRSIVYNTETGYLYVTVHAPSTKLTIFKYQPAKLFYLARDKTSWIDITPLTKQGGVAEKQLFYSNEDIEICFTDKSLPNVKFVKKLAMGYLNEVVLDITGQTSIDLAEYQNYNFFKLASSNSSEILNNIVNPPAHSFILFPLTISLTINSEEPTTATDSDIVLESTSLVLDGTRGHWLELRSNNFGPGSRQINAATY